MAKVTLQDDWTDPAGIEHQAGEVVEVDAATAARLGEGMRPGRDDEDSERRYLGPSWIGPGDDPEWE